MFELPAGGLGLVWLDGRNQGKQPEDAEMALYSASFDTSWKQTAEVSANARVCECCTTSAVVTPDGVVAAFRDRSPKEIRDIHVSRLESGKWTEAQVVHADNWEIDACPVNGPALSARGRQLAAAWFTAKDDKGQAFAAFSNDAGRTWGRAHPARGSGVARTRGRRHARRRIGRCDVGRVRGRAAASSDAARRAVRHALAGDDDQRRQSRERLPRVTRSGNELVLAWTEGAESEGAQRVEARSPPEIATKNRPVPPKIRRRAAGPKGDPQTWPLVDRSPGRRPQPKPSFGRCSVTMRTRWSFGLRPGLPEMMTWSPAFSVSLVTPWPPS